MALTTMQREQVRRLPVVDDFGVLQGMISINDVVLNAEEAKGKKAPALSYDDVVQTFKAICAHRILTGA